MFLLGPQVTLSRWANQIREQLRKVR